MLAILAADLRRLVVPLALLATLGRTASAQQAPAPPRAEGIDAILVADTLKGPEGTQFSLGAVKYMLDQVRDQGYDVNVTTLVGEKVSAGMIVAAILRLKPDRMKNRTLLFYYAGHGGTDPKTGHFLRTPRGDLPRSVLLDQIRKRSPKLAIVLTDCCSTRATTKIVLPDFPPAPDRRVVENLFLQHVGVVDMNASSCHPEKGIYQAAFYHPFRGLFTASFLAMCYPPGSPMQPEPDERDFLLRFRVGPTALSDRDRDGFFDWSEAREYLESAVPASFEAFRASVKSGEYVKMVASADMKLLESQASQDPQVFGPLAVRSDRPAPTATPPQRLQTLKRPRFGATFTERYERGGAYLAIANIEPGSPATKVSVWKSKRRSKTPFAMCIGDTILWANGVRVRSIGDLQKVLDTVPEGGELNIIGYDASTGLESKYEATAVLDSYSQ